MQVVWRAGKVIFLVIISFGRGMVCDRLFVASSAEESFCLVSRVFILLLPVLLSLVPVMTVFDGVTTPLASLVPLTPLTPLATFFDGGAVFFDEAVTVVVVVDDDDDDDDDDDGDDDVKRGMAWVCGTVWTVRAYLRGRPRFRGPFGSGGGAKVFFSSFSCRFISFALLFSSFSCCFC